MTATLQQKTETPPAKIPPLVRDRINAATFRDQKREKVYQLSNYARKLLQPTAIRTKQCRYPLPQVGFLPVSVNIEKETAKISSVILCGSVWSCPFCAYKIIIERRELLRQIFNYYLCLNKRFYFLTLTIRHQRKDNTPELLKKAWRSFAAKRKVKQLFDGVEYVKVFENTVGTNGLHSHFHIILICDQDMKQHEQTIRHQWNHNYRKQTNRQNNQHGVDLRIATNLDVVNYISKWDVIKEITGSAEKTSKTLFQLLTENDQDNALFVRYSQQLKGTRFMTFSRGISKMFKDREVTNIEIETGDHIVDAITRDFYMTLEQANQTNQYLIEVWRNFAETGELM